MPDTTPSVNARAFIEAADNAAMWAALNAAALPVAATTLTASTSVTSPTITATTELGAALKLYVGAGGGAITLTQAASGVVTLNTYTPGLFESVLFGGTNSSWPALRRRTTTIECRLADDSAIATFVGAMVLVAGAVTDAAFTNPVNGCHGFDTVNLKHYVRSGAAWVSSAAYT